jgi:hypothetical protein
MSSEPFVDKQLLITLSFNALSTCHWVRFHVQAAVQLFPQFRARFV